MEVATSSDFYNCSSCLLNFADATQYKKHYAAKFHQYNVKRKVIDLPPITQEQFEARFTTYQDSKKQETQAIVKVQTANRCEACQKTYANKNSYESHLNSKKHLENEKKHKIRLENSETQSLNSKATSQQTKSEKTTIDDITICLFCNNKSSSIEKNMAHMNKFHGFFTIESEFVSDLPGLIKYLAEKIQLGNICIYCDNKGKDFKSGEAVQTHMLDKGHCFMSKTQFDEYVGFYDFKLNQKEEADKEVEEDDVEVGQKQDLNVEEESEDDWEDEESEEESEDNQEIKEEDSEESDEDKKELTKNKNIKIQSEKDRQKELKKQFRSQYRQLNRQRLAKVEFQEGGELEFANGKVVGHRQYKNYYNMFYRNRADPFQNLKSILGPEYARTRQIQIQNKNYQMQLYNKHQSEKMLNKIDRIEHKSIHRDKKTYYKIGKANNKTKMHHYVNQNPL